MSPILVMGDLQVLYACPVFPQLLQNNPVFADTYLMGGALGMR